MWIKKLHLLGCVVFLSSAHAQWACTIDTQCADVSGSVCIEGACACAAGLQLVDGGSHCALLAPYHTSACIEDHQCSRLFTSFECRREGDTDALEGECRCRDGFHYFLGRCWRSVGFGATCAQDEECIDVPRDPYSLRCDGTCVCAPGYYERQRGECRKAGYGVGDGCVLDEDCQFPNSFCEINSRTCQLDSGSTNTRSPATTPETSRANLTSVESSSRVSNVTRLHGSECGVSSLCDAPFECFLGACVCPVGYYASEDGARCLAELGSSSTEDQCAGFLAQVIDGICSCPANFFYEDNMRDCVKVTRRISEACTTDDNCLTFGAASFCGPPQEPWFMRNCECDTGVAVWDDGRQMCRLFVGVGEMCEVDSDCLAGELDIQCVADETGQGYCECPEGLLSVGGLCLTTGLDIGETCQASQECTATANTGCINGVCACDDGYQQIEAICAPIIGGTCTQDTDCVINNTACRSGVDGLSTCQCTDNFVTHEDECWPVSLGYQASCNVTSQCRVVMGDRGVCVEGACVCETSYHFRDGNCWPETGLFEGCSRTSECFLSSMSDRVVCRNSLCQCDFDFPYSEELQTCVSSATNIFGSISMIGSALIYIILRYN